MLGALGRRSAASAMRGCRVEAAAASTSHRAMMSTFHYEDLFQAEKPDETVYRKLTGDYVSTFEVEGKTVLKVEPEALTLLASTAMRDIAHLLRPAHLKQLKAILDDPEATENDKFVALELLKNANVAAGYVLPSCQDTGTAIVVGKRGQHVWTDGEDETALSKGVFDTYTETNLRYSQVAPLDMYTEVNTKTNLPAQMNIYATKGNQYKFMFMAKGGGARFSKSLLSLKNTPKRLRALYPWLLRLFPLKTAKTYRR